MPKLSGPDSYDRILEIRRDVPLIFTSGYSDEAASLAPMLGARAILLQKPYTPKLLGQKIRELLDQTVAANRVNL